MAIAVAEHIAGSEERFAELMNRKAEELGMKHTEFRNASGLPDPEQVTTARDMITLALRLHDRFPRYYPLFATRTFTWGGETYRNHNTLLFRYQGLEGLKTGYIRASGFNLVAAARRGKKHVFVAYFGGKTAALRNVAVRAQLDAAFAKASEPRRASPPPLVTAKAKGGRLSRRPGEAAPSVAVAPAAAAWQSGRRRPPASRLPAYARSRAGVAARPRRGPKAEAPPSHALAAMPRRRHAADQRRHQALPHPDRRLPDQRRGRAPAGVGAASVPAPCSAAHAAYMSQVKRGDKVFFRARYVGFDAQAAAAGACSELKRWRSIAW